MGRVGDREGERGFEKGQHTRERYQPVTHGCCFQVSPSLFATRPGCPDNINQEKLGLCPRC